MKSINLKILSEYRSALMGVATIMILCCHCPYWCNLLPAFVKKVLVMGYLGVDIFLFLSGIGMFYSLNKYTIYQYNKSSQNLASWYTHRYKRILIPYLIIAIPCYLTITLLDNESFAMFICNVSTLSYWLYHKGAWYIAMLFPLYLITPPLLRLLSGKHKWFIFAILSLICLGSAFLNSTDVENDIIYNIAFVVRRLPSYFLGIVIARDIMLNKSLTLMWSLIIITSCLLITAVFYLYGLPFEMFAIIPVITAVCIVFNYTGATSTSINRICSSLGQVSLESYIFNILLPLILINIDWNSIYPGINIGNYIMYGLTVTIGISLSYLCSYLSNKYILKKCLTCNDRNTVFKSIVNKYQ